MAMTTQELRALGAGRYGAHWQTPLARAIGVSARHMRRLACGDAPISSTMEADIRRAVGAAAAGDAQWPRAEWIIGEGAHFVDGARADARYIVHTRHPRFVARLASEGDIDADTLSGIVYDAGGVDVCEIVWIDEPPASAEMLELMESAADAIDEADGGGIGARI